MPEKPEEVERIDGRRSRFRCHCGVEFIAARSNVTTGNTKTCGCSRGTHHMTGTPLYKAWENMKQRAGNRAGIYPTYVDVGIDERWSTFQGFLDNPPTTGRPFEPGLALSRYGDTGDYSPENARFLTRSENTSEQAHPLKTHCIHGHPYTEENTKRDTTKGTRRCRICATGNTRRWRTRTNERNRGAGTN